ncbi:MAG: hypothetical protein A2516_06690 [Alphaproteobacteria bacterium RIFOXYD12_FULL_60_8]|nr:MAG: hypothetical protein A2516_06690 [Alphaproteobacteria bacterium RIFOXYD12_FULL_60_8]
MSRSMMNQVIAAIIFAIVGMVAISAISSYIMQPKEAAAPAPTPAPTPTAEETPPASTDDLTVAVREADAEDGQRNAASKCKGCHSFDKGGPNKVGPNLWEVVGKSKATAVGYIYSDPMKAKGGTWSLADLDAFLTKPVDFVPGTRMSYVGLRNPEDRAALIAYLHSLSDTPFPLP